MKILLNFTLCLFFLTTAFSKTYAAKYAILFNFPLPTNQEEALKFFISETKKYLAAGNNTDPFSSDTETTYQQALDSNDLTLKNRIRLLESASNQGHLGAMTALGALLEFQSEFKPLSKATELYRVASEKGYIPAMPLYAQCLKMDSSVGQSLIETEKWARKAAQGGFVPGMVYLGLLIAEHAKEPFNSEAAEWFQIAAEQGNPAAQNFLAKAYFEGRLGYSPDYVKAEFWIRKAFSQGFAPATLGMGVALLESSDKTSQKEGFTLLKRLALEGDPVAMTNLGDAFIRGTGCQANRSEGEKWLRRAVSFGDSRAQTMVGNDLLNSSSLEQKKEGFQTTLLAAKNGSIDAAVRVGLAYTYGEGCEQNFKQAAQWLRKAVSAGYISATHDLCTVLGYSEDPQDQRDSFILYKAAAEKGDSLSMYQLSLNYRLGRECHEDVGLADSWLKKAADAGRPAAIRDLGRQLISSQDPDSQIRGFQLLSRAAELGDQFAMYELSRSYKNGVGCQVNPTLSKEWHERSMQNGSRPDRWKVHEPILIKEERVLFQALQVAEMRVSLIENAIRDLRKLKEILVKQDRTEEENQHLNRFGYLKKKSTVTSVSKTIGFDLGLLEQRKSEAMAILKAYRKSIYRYRQNELTPQHQSIDALKDCKIIIDELQRRFEFKSPYLTKLYNKKIKDILLFALDQYASLLTPQTRATLGEFEKPTLSFIKTDILNQDVVEEIEKIRNDYRHGKIVTLQQAVREAGPQILAAMKPAAASAPAPTRGQGSKNEKPDPKPNLSTNDDSDIEAITQGSVVNVKSEMSNSKSTDKFRWNNKSTTSIYHTPVPAAARPVPAPTTPEVEPAAVDTRRLVFLTKDDAETFRILMTREKTSQRQIQPYLKLLKNFIYLNSPEHAKDEAFLKSVSNLKKTKDGNVAINKKGRGMKLRFVRYDGESYDHGFHITHGHGNKETNDIPKRMLNDYRGVFQAFGIKYEDIVEVKANFQVSERINQIFDTEL